MEKYYNLDLSSSELALINAPLADDNMPSKQDIEEFLMKKIHLITYTCEYVYYENYGAGKYYESYDDKYYWEGYRNIDEEVDEEVDEEDDGDYEIPGLTEISYMFTQLDYIIIYLLTIIMSRRISNIIELNDRENPDQQFTELWKTILHSARDIAKDIKPISCYNHNIFVITKLHRFLYSCGIKFGCSKYPRSIWEVNGSDFEQCAGFTELFGSNHTLPGSINSTIWSIINYMDNNVRYNNPNYRLWGMTSEYIGKFEYRDVLMHVHYNDDYCYISDDCRSDSDSSDYIV